MTSSPSMSALSFTALFKPSEFKCVKCEMCNLFVDVVSLCDFTHSCDGIPILLRRLTLISIRLCSHRRQNTRASTQTFINFRCKTSTQSSVCRPFVVSNTYAIAFLLMCRHTCVALLSSSVSNGVNNFTSRINRKIKRNFLASN